jgi:hypothetical protein
MRDSMDKHGDYWPTVGLGLLAPIILFILTLIVACRFIAKWTRPSWRTLRWLCYPLYRLGDWLDKWADRVWERSQP